MEPQPSSPGLRAGLPAAVFLLAFIAFSPALGGEFLNWDDNLVLTDHQDWKGLGGDQFRAAFTNFRAGHYHPLTWLSFGLDYELWGMNPRGYHLLNLLLHAATAVLVYGILVFLLDRFALYGVSRISAAIGAAFFAIHPLRVESVAWITERRDVLSGCLLALTVLAWLKWTSGADWRWYAVSLAAFALSLLSKAWGMTLPFVLVILDLYPLRRGIRIKEKLPFFALAIAAAVVAYVAQKQAGAMRVVEDHTLVDRLIQSAYGLFFYPAKTAVPVDLNPLYALKPSFNPFEAKYVIGALCAVAITVVVILIRRRRPEYLSAWLVYAISVAPVLGLAQSGPQLVADRYSYLSCIPFAVLVAAGLAKLRMKPAWIGAAAVVAAFGVLAWNYSHEWRDSVSLWSRAARLDPENTQAWFNLGSAKLAREHLDKPGAIDALSRAVKLKPNYAAAWLNLGNARMPADPKGAVADYDAAIAALPNYADGYANRAVAKITGIDPAGALADLDQALRLDPNHYRARLNRAVARITKREFKAAREDLDRAVRIQPGDPDGWYYRAIARGEDGDIAGAIEDCARALSVAPPKWAHAEEAEGLLARARRRKDRP